MYCGVASMCTCRYILKKHPMANLKHLSSLHMGLSETGESRNSLANHHVPSQMAMLWHVMPFWKYTQSSDTMHCSCCTTRTHWSGICIYIYTVYICMYIIYMYIYYIYENCHILHDYTHTLSHLSRWNRYHISFPIYILFHEYAMKSHDKKSRTAPWAKATCWAL
jgi:hypothetical protein